MVYRVVAVAAAATTAFNPSSAHHRRSPWKHAMTSPAIRHINHDRSLSPPLPPDAIQRCSTAPRTTVPWDQPGEEMRTAREESAGTVRKNCSWDNVSEKKKNTKKIIINCIFIVPFQHSPPRAQLPPFFHPCPPPPTVRISTPTQPIYTITPRYHVNAKSMFGWFLRRRRYAQYNL